MWYLLKIIVCGIEIKSGVFGVMYGVFIMIVIKILSMIGNEVNNIVIVF